MLSPRSRGSDGAGDDWSISQPTHSVLPQICYKFTGRITVLIRELYLVVKQCFTSSKCPPLSLDGVLFQRSHSHQQGKQEADHYYCSIIFTRRFSFFLKIFYQLVFQFDGFSRELCVKSLLEIMDMFCHRLKYVHT